MKMNSMAQVERWDEALYDAPRGIPEKFWNRRPRIEGHDPNDWELFSIKDGTVTIRTRNLVASDSFVFAPTMGTIRLAQYLPDQNILVVEHRISLNPPRSIYAAYAPLGFSRETLNLRQCHGSNADCLPAGEYVGFTPGGSATRFFVRFSDRAQIGRSEFRPEFRSAPLPSPQTRRRRPTPSAPPPPPLTGPSAATSPSLPSYTDGQQQRRFRRLIQQNRPPRPPRFERPPGLSWVQLAKLLKAFVQTYRGQPPWLSGATEVVRLYWRAISEDYRLALFVCSSVGFADGLARLAVSHSSLISCQFPSDMANYNMGMLYSAPRRRYYEEGCRRATHLAARLDADTALLFFTYLRSTFGQRRDDIREGILRSFMPEVRNPELLYR